MCDVILAKWSCAILFSTGPASALRIRHSWSNTASIKGNTYHFIAENNKQQSKMRKTAWASECEREERNEQWRNHFWWTGILSNFAFHFSIVHVNIIVCINLLHPSLLMTAFPRVVSLSFDFQILRIALALRSLPNEKLLFWAWILAAVTSTRRPGEVRARARARSIPLSLVVLMSVESIFAPKTASEFSTLMPKLTESSRLVGFGSKD